MYPIVVTLLAENDETVVVCATNDDIYAFFVDCCGVIFLGSNDWSVFKLLGAKIEIYKIKLISSGIGHIRIAVL